MRNCIGLIAVLFAVSGCAQGGILGVQSAAELKPSQFVSSASSNEETETIVGVSDGGLIGGGLGKGLSRRDHLVGLEAEYRALETTPAGDSVPWRNKKTGVGGTVTAFQPYRVGSQDCRQYSHNVEIRAAQRTARGTACRTDNGSWIILN